MTKRHALDLHVYPANMQYEGRILQIADHLHQKGIFSAIELAGTLDPTLPTFEVLDSGVRIRRFRLHWGQHGALRGLINWLLWFARIIFHYAPQRVACVSAHSVQVLPLCWLLSILKNCPLLYEPHHLETEVDVGGNLANKTLRQLCEKMFIRHATHVTAPNRHTAKWYKDRYNLEKVWVIRNLPAVVAMDPLPEEYFAKRFGFPSEDIVFLYQGRIEKQRGIELLVRAFEQVPRDRHIVFLGPGPLTSFVDAAAVRLWNVHLHPPVPPQELMRYASAADIGVMMIENYSLHYRYCYPGKYCQYLSSGRAVLISDFLLLREEVEALNCGWLARPDSASIAKAVHRIDRSEISLKEEGVREWAAINNWNNERQVIDEIYSHFAAAMRQESEDARAHKC